MSNGMRWWRDTEAGTGLPLGELQGPGEAGNAKRAWDVLAGYEERVVAYLEDVAQAYEEARKGPKKRERTRDALRRWLLGCEAWWALRSAASTVRHDRIPAVPKVAQSRDWKTLRRHWEYLRPPERLVEAEARIRAVDPEFRTRYHEDGQMEVYARDKVIVPAIWREYENTIRGYHQQRTVYLRHYGKNAWWQGLKQPPRLNRRDWLTVGKALDDVLHTRTRRTPEGLVARTAVSLEDPDGVVARVNRDRTVEILEPGRVKRYHIRDEWRWAGRKETSHTSRYQTQAVWGKVARAWPVMEALGPRLRTVPWEVQDKEDEQRWRREERQRNRVRKALDPKVVQAAHRCGGVSLLRLEALSQHRDFPKLVERFAGLRPRLGEMGRADAEALRDRLQHGDSLNKALGGPEDPARVLKELAYKPVDQMKDGGLKRMEEALRRLAETTRNGGHTLSGQRHALLGREVMVSLLRADVERWLWAWREKPEVIAQLEANLKGSTAGWPSVSAGGGWDMYLNLGTAGEEAVTVNGQERVAWTTAQQVLGEMLWRSTKNLQDYPREPVEHLGDVCLTIAEDLLGDRGQAWNVPARLKTAGVRGWGRLRQIAAAMHRWEWLNRRQQVVMQTATGEIWWMMETDEPPVVLGGWDGTLNWPATRCDTVEQLRDEGKRMGHCVAGWAPDVAWARRAVFHLPPEAERHVRRVDGGDRPRWHDIRAGRRQGAAADGGAGGAERDPRTMW